MTLHPSLPTAGADVEMTNGRHGPSRRGVVAGAAAVWAAPAITVIAQAPAYASSGTLRITALTPDATAPTPAYRTGSTERFTVLVSTTTGRPVSNTIVTFALARPAGDTTSSIGWLSLSSTAASTSAVATTGPDGTATIPVRYLPGVVPSLPTTLTLSATIAETPSTSASWSIAYRAPRPGTTAALGAFGVVTSATAAHSLVHRNGSGWAFGNGSDGRLGLGSIANALEPASITTMSALAGKKVSLLARGSRPNHGLALTDDGVLFGWGNNGTGELGDGTTTARNAPVEIPTAGSSLAGKTITDLAVGTGFSVALASDGTVHAWGANSSGQVGDGTTTNRSRPVAVSTSTSLASKTVTAIAAGSNHALALASDGTVHAWGNSTSGQLGNNSTVSRSSPVAVTTAGTSLAGKTVTAISAAFSLSLALTSDGTAHAWGFNASGQLGDGTAPTQRAIAGAVTTSGTSLAGKTITAIAAGGTHSLALTSDGSLHAWGLNTSGQLGDGTTTNRTTPVAVTTTGTSLAGKTVTAIAAGGTHSLALTSDGSLHAWGDNTSGQLGDGTTTTRATAGIVTVAGTSLAGKSLTTIRVGALHSLALASDGTVHAWGLNGSGQLGDGTIAQRATATRVGILDGTDTSLAGKEIVALAAGNAHSLALASDGTLHAWGNNNRGQLGDATTTTRDRPVAVTMTGTSLAGKAVIAIATGSGHNVALASDGTLHTWGNNTNGQLGDGTTTNRATPVAVTVADTSLAGKTITAISAGGFHTLALASDGTLHAWGLNDNGQLGDATTTSRPTAVAVTIADTSLAGKTITAISAGTSHNLALASDGTLHGWGLNTTRQLSDGTVTQRTTAVAVTIAGTSLAGKIITAISAGNVHNLVLASDGTLHGWGSNTENQLGDGTSVQRNTAVAVATASASIVGKTITAVAAGNTHSLALASDGTLHAWGNNVSGKLGDGTTTLNRPRAVLVKSL